MGLKNPKKCVGRFSIFDFASVSASAEGKGKWAKLGIAKTGLSNPKSGQESKKQKNCLSRFKKWKLSTEILFSVKPLFICPMSWRITTNVLQAGISFWLCPPLHLGSATPKIVLACC